MKKFGKILLIIIIIAVICFIGFRFLGDGFSSSSQTQSLDFKDIGELATQEADVVQVEQVDKDALKEKTGIDIPFVGTNIVYSYNVAVKAGFDFTKITVDKDDTNKTILVHMPDPAVLSVDVDTASFKSYTDYESIFNQLSQEEQNEMLGQLQTDAQTTAENNGLLDKAKENGELLIENMIIGQLGETDYDISFSYDI